MAPPILPSDADPELVRLQHRRQQLCSTAELAEMLDSKESPLHKLLSVSQRLLDDSKRVGGSLVDLSFRVEGKGSLLLLLLDTLPSTLGEDVNPAKLASSASKQKEMEQKASAAFDSVLSHVLSLIRASYDTSIKGSDGKDALALLTSLVAPLDVDNWSYLLVEALLDRGADVNTRFEGGSTPLIHWCSPFDSVKNGCGVLLLLNRGANIVARDDRGMTAMHHLAEDAQLDVCKELADAGWLAAADLTLLNNKGETALQVAQWKLAEDATHAAKRSMCNVLHAHALLKAEARPVVFRWLSHSLMLPDLAHIVLSFMDGRERA